MARARFWVACGVASGVLAACGSGDGKRASQGAEGGGAGEPSETAGAPGGGKGGTAPEPEAGTGGSEPQPEGGTGGTAQAGSPPIVEGGGGTGPEPLSALVEPKYPTNGAYWLDYVKDDGDSRTEATDTACEPTIDGPTYAACVHGGEIRRVALPSVASCDDVEATDALGAFDWICQAAGDGIELVSTGLAAGKHMSDLIDFGGNAWKPNSVTITQGGDELVSTEPAIWWQNPIARLAAATCTADVGAEHDIFLLDAASSGGNCTGKVAKIGLTTVPGETVTDFAFFGKGAFNWYEGEYTIQAKFSVLTPGGFGFQVVRNVHFDVLAAGASFNAAIGLGQTRASLVRDIEANGGRIVIGAGSTVGLTVTDVVSDGAKVDAISFNSCSDCSIERVDITNSTGRAINVQGVSPRLLIRDVAASNNLGGGIQLTQTNDSRVENVGITDSGGGGVTATVTSRTVFKSIRVDGAVGVGVAVDQGDDNRLVDIHVGNAGANGVYMVGNRHVLQHARISCGKGASITTGTGVQLSSNNSHSRIQDVTISSCRYGIDMAASAMVVQGVTAAANEDAAFRNASYGHFMEDLVAIDSTYGLYFLSNTLGNARVRNFAATHNQSASVYSNNSTVSFGENLIVGNSGTIPDAPDCIVASTTGLDGNCVSGAVLTTDASVLASIVGLTTDATNPQGGTGTAGYDSITSFLAFESDTRRFIRGSTFPDYALRGPCKATETCAVLDLALKASDTLLRNRNALPTGNDFTTQVWFISNNEPVSQATCDTRLPGSTFAFDTTNRCESVFLKHAWELLEDGVGDNDGLCESNETCEVARNLGGYQGHGPLVAAGAFTPGTLTGITLVQRQTNGY